MTWTEIGNFGVPMLILAGVAVAVWKFGWYAVHKVFGDEGKGTRGLAGDWVANEMEWRGKLTERLQSQTAACEGHIQTVKALGDSLAQQIDAANLAKEAASAAAQAAAEGNQSLAHIDEVLCGRTDLIKHTADGVQDLRGCMFHMCDVMQAFVAKEFPNSVGDVSAYLLAIKKRVNDQA
jgi:hypothetical protein